MVQDYGGLLAKVFFILSKFNDMLVSIYLVILAIFLNLSDFNNNNRLANQGGINIMRNTEQWKSFIGNFTW
jgi:hypothetical protein